MSRATAVRLAGRASRAGWRWQMRRLHDAGFDHRDLKFANLLVAADPTDPRIWFLDLDGVRVWRRLPARRAVQNLARINVSACARRRQPCRSAAISEMVPGGQFVRRVEELVAATWRRLRGQKDRRQSDAADRSDFVGSFDSEHVSFGSLITTLR